MVCHDAQGPSSYSRRPASLAQEPYGLGRVLSLGLTAPLVLLLLFFADWKRRGEAETAKVVQSGFMHARVLSCV